MQFPFLDLQAQFARIRSEVLPAVEKVLADQHFILGPEVEKLETELALMLGVSYAVGCASGSDALLLAMMALDIDSGDEVITSPFTFGATAGAIARLKARPVFVDIERDTYNLDPDKLEAAITPRTRAIMPVHLFGMAAEMDPILEIAARFHLPVIEDAAQAIGAQYNGRPVGALGTMACFSFFPSKNLGCAGDGGLVTTDDPQLAERLRMLRVHGCRKKYVYDAIGINSRLDALQAAILRVKLRHLPAWTFERQRNAMRYARLFAEYGLKKCVQPPFVPANRLHVYNQFVVRTPERDRMRQHLQRLGIPTEIYYPSSLHLERAYAYLGYQAGDFPESEAASSEAVALPIFSELTEDQQRAVVEAMASFFATLQQ
jgi:dTDP-4-amino-4,6-dideoxygalactose transaminase